jgi:hypothetical protein
MIFDEGTRKWINNNCNVRIALRRTWMLGNGCEEAFLIDESPLQKSVDTDEIMGRMGVLWRDLVDLKMVPPVAERHGVALNTAHRSARHYPPPQEQTTCRQGAEARNAPARGHQWVTR